MAITRVTSDGFLMAFLIMPLKYLAINLFQGGLTGTDKAFKDPLKL